MRPASPEERPRREATGWGRRRHARRSEVGPGPAALNARRERVYISRAQSAGAVPTRSASPTLPPLRGGRAHSGTSSSGPAAVGAQAAEARVEVRRLSKSFQLGATVLDAVK